MAACATVGQPLAAPQAVGHHTAVDGILHSSVAAGSPCHLCAHRSQGVGSSQGPDAPRLIPCGIRHQAAGRGAQPLAQREAAGHDSGAVPAALVPWRRSLQPAEGRAGAAHHPLNSHAPSAAAAMTHNHSLAGLKAGSLPSFLFFFFFWLEESLHAHRCQSYEQPERQIKQTTGECRVHSTSYDKASCFAMVCMMYDTMHPT